MRKVFTFFSLIIILAFAGNLHAQTNVFLSKNSGDWNIKTNWIPSNTLPGPNDSVIIDIGHNMTLSTNVTIKSITFSSSTSVITIGNSSLNFSGIVTGSGTFTCTSASTINITGSGNAGTIYFTTGSQTLGNFSLNRSTSGTVTIGSNLTISGSLTMSNGNIITGINVLTLGTSTSNLGTLTYTTGRIIGSFCRWFNNLDVSGVAFPIGTSTYDRSFTINRTNVDPTNGGGNLTASFITGDAGNNNTIYVEDSTNSPAYILDVYSRQGYWSIVKGADNTMIGKYVLTLETTGFTGISDITKVRILKKTTNSGAYWILEGLHVDGYSTKVVRSGMTTFSNFVLAGNSSDNPFDGPLPVTLKSFTSVISGRDVKLNWVTEKEVNNKGFDIERVKSSESGVKGYEKIGFVESKGNVNTATNYSFDDKNLVSGRYKYRLKQIDYNSNYEYFELNGEVTVGVPKKFDLSQNYPNPFNPVTKINFDIPEDGKVSLVIYDMLGREDATLVNDVRTAGYYTVSFDASKLASGMYFYRLSAGNYSAVKKMAVIK